LGFLYRTSSVQLGVAGLQPVVGVHGIQNVDVSELVDGHLQYRYLTGSILRKIGFEDVDIVEVERAEAEMKKQQEEEKKEREENEGKTGNGEGEDKEKLESEVKKKNEQSILQMMQEKTKNLNIGSYFGGGESKQPGEKTQVKAEQHEEK
jgi:hypothetical protein